MTVPIILLLSCSYLKKERDGSKYLVPVRRTYVRKCCGGDNQKSVLFWNYHESIISNSINVSNIDDRRKATMNIIMNAATKNKSLWSNHAISLSAQRNFDKPTISKLLN